MCDPVTLTAATVALAATQAVTSYVGQNRAAKANETAANLNYARERDAIGRQGVLIDKEQSESAFDTAIAGVRAEGDIVASASDRGLASSSISQSLNAAMFGIGRQVTAEDTNRDTQRANLASGKEDASIRRQTQINSVPKAGSLSLILGLGNAALSGAKTYQSTKAA